MFLEDKRTWAEIDLGCLEHNYREIRRVLPEGCRIAGICKANAYGHGAVPVARKLERLGADCVAVSCLSEAEELRTAGVGLPILVLAPSPASLACELSRIGATQAVGDIENARRMSFALGAAGKTLSCHLKLDTGMGRTGVNVTTPEGIDEAAELVSLPNLSFEGVFTHFAVSDEPKKSFTDEQTALFNYAVSEIERRSGRSLGIRHCANSGAVVSFRDCAMDMARPGLLLYGLYPGQEHGGLDLQPVMRLMTRVAAITEHKPGDTVSYGRDFVCERPTRLAVIPAGYADGLHRSLSGRMEVLINGARAPQVGRICMDMCMIDITDLDGVRVGDPVTIYGSGLTADEQAQKAGTIAYELLCAVSPRVPRVYIE